MKRRILLFAVLPWVLGPGRPWANRSVQPSASQAGLAQSKPAAVAETRPLPATDAALRPVTLPHGKVGGGAVLRSEDAITRFQFWAQRYLQGDESQRAALLAEGLALAAERRTLIKAMIANSPQSAIECALPRVLRQDLPDELQALLEQPVAELASLTVLAASPESLAQGGSPYLRQVRTRSGRHYEAHVYGRRASDFRQLETFHALGVALDGQLALSENPGRLVEVGERLPKGKPQQEICPISGENTRRQAEAAAASLPAEATAVETGESIVFLCNGAHVQPYLSGLILAEGGSGGAGGFLGMAPPSSVPSVGVLRVLYVPAIFNDQGQTPASEATCYNLLRQVGDFYQAQSFGKLTLTATVTPPVRLPGNQSWYKAKDSLEIDGLRLEMDHAKAAARALGYDWRDYDCFCVRAAGGARAPTSFAMVGSDSAGSGEVWMRNDSLSTLAHEIGHSFGLLHANFWQTNGASVIGPGSNMEYGDPFDNMGSSTPPQGHYNVQAKHQIGWLGDRQAPLIERSGLYRLAAFDTPRLLAGQLHAMRLRKDGDRTYWLGMRRLHNGNASAQSGVMLGWKWPRQTGGGNWQLLDNTPGSTLDRQDAAIGIGATFTDTEAGLHLTNLGPSSTDSSLLDLRVELGDFSANRPPTSLASPERVVVAPDTNISFSVSASDPDGDALAYFWRWQDNITSPNAPSVSRSFSSAGVHGWLCVVSDMKGGISIRRGLVIVGNGGSQHTISGRLTRSDGSPLRGIAVSASGSNGTLSDDEGRYTLSNLAAGTYTVTPTAQGMQFTESFNNRVQVGPSFQGADFIVSDLPAVTLSALVQSVRENQSPAPAAFRLSRSGPTTSALTVYLLPAAGSARLGSDYQLTPAPTALANTPYLTLSIPQGQPSVDLAVNALTDLSIEGMESIELTLAGDTGYRTGGLTSRSINIEDSDSNLPTVSLRSSAAQAMEGESLELLLERSGDPSAALELSLQAEGSSDAVPGEDYEALPATLGFAPGQRQFSLPLRLPENSRAQGRKTLRLSLANSGQYLADPTRRTLELRLLDNDLNTLSVEAADASATEDAAATDPAVFLIRRQGDLSRSLLAHYSAAGSALHGTDYRALEGFVLFAAGQSQAAVVIEARPDAFAEGSETVTLMIADGDGAYRCDLQQSATVNILDAPADKPLLELITSTAAAVEASTAGQFRIISKGGSGTITVNYSISGTASAGIDYTLAGLNTTTLRGSLSLTLGSGMAVANINPLSDSLFEEVETIVMTLEPSADYQIAPNAATSTLLLRDDDQPTVYVDAQVGNATGNSVLESDTSTICKFWISRTGSTAAALSVNYAVGGTASPGLDYSSGGITSSVIIPIGASGVDIPLSALNDNSAEGSENIVLSLNPGSTHRYARGNSASITILDDETSGLPLVSFGAAASSATESSGSVDIPLSLSAPATSTLSVDYALDSGPGTPSQLLGTWVRVDKAGNNLSAWLSYDGVEFTPLGSTVSLSSLPSNGLLAGIWINSGSSSSSARARVLSYEITNLAAANIGAETQLKIGSSNQVHGATRGSDGSLWLNAGGGSSSSQDNGLLVCRQLSNAENCRITARIAHLDPASFGTSQVGVMLRASNAVSAAHFSCLASMSDGRRSHLSLHRAQSSSNAVAGTAVRDNLAKGSSWLRLQRSGDELRALHSSDGQTWHAAGDASHVRLAGPLLVGLAASSRSDGLPAQAVFDEVTLTGASQPLQSQPLGQTRLSGSAVASASRWTINASGRGIMPGFSSAEDSGHLAASTIDGDFVLSAKITSLSSDAVDAQAGLMVRETGRPRSKAMWWGLSGTSGSAAEWLTRLTCSSSAQGAGIDFQGSGGRVTFLAGEQSKTITVALTRDELQEPTENFSLQLRNPINAILAAPNLHTLSLLDSNPAPTTPSLQWATANSSADEASGEAWITAVLSSPARSIVRVNYSVLGSGSATAGVDHLLASGTLEFAAGQSLSSLRVALVNDNEIEATETVLLQLNQPQGATLASLGTHTLSLRDDDTPRIEVRPLIGTVRESDQQAAFTLTRSGSTAEALTVGCALGGSAQRPADYTLNPSSIVFAAGSAETVLVVPLVDDSIAEPNKTLELSLVAGSGYVLAEGNSASVVLNDDDINTVSIIASQPQASENGTQGELRLQRSGPLGAGLLVGLLITGTATSGSDYETLPVSVSFAPQESSATLRLRPLQDLMTEGGEDVVVALSASAQYLIGPASHASVNIRDDDIAPTVFISNPVSKSAVLSTGNGLILEASATDDGLPADLTYQWRQIFGPGTCSLGQANSARCEAQFDSVGTYGLRVEVSDGQLSASDDVVVQYGGFQPASWVAINQGGDNARGISGLSDAGLHEVLATGSGYSTAADSGHFRFRQLPTGSSTGSLTARLTRISGPTGGTAGIALRQSSWQGAIRSLLLLDAQRNLQWRNRSAASNVDAVNLPSGSRSLPLWLRLSWTATAVSASVAPDVSGAPGSWTNIGTQSLALGSAPCAGMVASSGGGAAQLNAAFDQVSLTPAVGAGGAIHSEDLGASPAIGSSSFNSSNNRTSLTAWGTQDLSGGHFRYQQVWGDCVITARLMTHGGSVRGSQTGIAIRENNDQGAFGFFGMTTLDGFQAQWRSAPGGGINAISSPGELGNWIRLVRRGNSLTAMRAVDQGGQPGAWSAASAALPAALSGPLLVGALADSNSSSASSTGTLDQLSIEPYNRAPVITMAPPVAGTPVALSASVQDDQLPAPPASLTLQWRRFSGLGSLVFSQPNSNSTVVQTSIEGLYDVGLTASDGDSQSFALTRVDLFLSPFAKWLTQSDSNLENIAQIERAAAADLDSDGLPNLLEYALGTRAGVSDASPVIFSSIEEQDGRRYLTLRATLDPNVPDVEVTVEASDTPQNPESWSSAGLIIERLSPSHEILAKDLILPQRPARFLRLRASLR